jgi:hypothetical protein
VSLAAGAGVKLSATPALRPADVVESPEDGNKRIGLAIAKGVGLWKESAMGSRAPLVLLLAGILAAGPAAAREPERRDVLDLYGDAYSAARLGFSCTPAAVPNGPSVPDYERMRLALARRLERVAERLSVLSGRSRIDAIEREIAGQETGVWRTGGCDLEQTRRARLRYGRILRRLEKRLYPRP